MFAAPRMALETEARSRFHFQQFDLVSLTLL
jgi:hypothetical protein